MDCGYHVWPTARLVRDNNQVQTSLRGNDDATDVRSREFDKT